MNIAATSKEEILEVSRKLVLEKGLSTVNMRMVAKECGVAVGSIYNYFPSKSDLVCATVETIWKDIFHMTGKPLNSMILLIAYRGFSIVFKRVAKNILSSSPCIL